MKLKILFPVFFALSLLALVFCACSTERNHTHKNEDGVMEVFIDPDVSSPFNGGKFQGW